MVVLSWNHAKVKVLNHDGFFSSVQLYLGRHLDYETGFAQRDLDISNLLRYVCLRNRDYLSSCRQLIMSYGKAFLKRRLEDLQETTPESKREV